MKKIRFMVAICAALMIAAPVMALEVEVSGHYFVETYNNSNETLDKNNSTNDYGRMEFMAKPVFKINDNITLTTQFTALQGHVWGQPTSTVYSQEPLAGSWDLFPARVEDENDFEWKAAYMTIKTSIGGFLIGRYIDTPWGTGLGDSTASHGKNSLHKDRAMWVVPIGDFVSGLVYQRNGEYDKGLTADDADYHKYYGFSAYKQENWSTGLLIARYEHRNYLSQKDLREFQVGYSAYTNANDSAMLAKLQYDGTRAATLAAVGGSQAIVAAQETTAGTPLNLAKTALDSANGAAALAASNLSGKPLRSDLGLWVINPYFMGTFGPFYAEAELLYGNGEVDLNEIRTYQGNTFDSIDAEALAATLDLKYDIAGLTLNAGGTYVQGDSNPLDDETNAVGYFEQSLDLEHGFLLTSDVSELNYSLGGTDENGIPLGNVSGGPTTITGPAGYQSFWLGAKYQLLDNLKLGLLFVSSKADDAPKTNAGVEWDDDHGTEYDFTVEWDIMNNLTFWGVVAHLDAGDYWKAGGFNAEVENNTTIFGRLTVAF